MSLTARLLTLPSWLALFMIITVIVALSLLGLFLVSRRIPHQVMKCHNDVAGFIFATIGVMYGVMLGFDIYMVWQDLDDSRKIAVLESGEALGLHRDLLLYPDEGSSKPVRVALVDFIDLVIHEEYPAMASMRVSEATNRGFDHLWESLRAMEPRSPKEQIIFQEILGDMNRLAKYRLERLEASQSELPGEVWLTLLVGGFITIAFTFFFGSENTWAQVTMTALLAAMIATIIFVIIQLDHPFMGEISIKPDHYMRLFESLGGAR